MHPLMYPRIPVLHADGNETALIPHKRKEWGDFAGVYSIVNMETGRQYIGSTRNLSSRYAQHCTALGARSHSCHALQHSYNNHGADNHAFVIHRKYERTPSGVTKARLVEARILSGMKDTVYLFNTGNIKPRQLDPAIYTWTRSGLRFDMDLLQSEAIKGHGYWCACPDTQKQLRELEKKAFAFECKYRGHMHESASELKKAETALENASRYRAEVERIKTMIETKEAKQ